jgi:hypothetical protein
MKRETKHVKPAKRKRYRRGLYPWEKWLKLRKPFTLYHRVDYDCPTYSMAQQVRNRLVQTGLRASITIAPNEESLTITLIAGENSVLPRD